MKAGIYLGKEQTGKSDRTFSGSCVHHIIKTNASQLDRGQILQQYLEDGFVIMEKRQGMHAFSALS